MEENLTIEQWLEKSPALKKMSEYTLFVEREELDKIKESGKVDVEIYDCSVSIEFLKKVLNDDACFSYVKKYFNGDISEFNVCSIYRGDTIGNIGYTQGQIVRGIELLIEYKQLFLTDIEKNRYNELKEIISFETFLNKEQDKYYEINIDGTKYKIKIKNMIELMMMPNEEFDDLCSNDSVSFINGIPKTHFIYASYKYFRETGVLNKYMVPENIYNRYDDIEKLQKIDIQSLNQLLETTDTKHNDFELNEALKNQILEGIPENYSKLEKAIYIYIKMCKLLTYDDEYYAVNQKGIATEKHKDINYASNITPSNNSVVCFEFNLIYSKLLNGLGINFSSNYKGMIGEAYGIGHANLRFRCDKFLVKADSVTTILKGDLMQAKLNQPLKGLKCTNYNTNTFKEFNQMVTKVYELVATQEKDSKKDVQVEHVQTFEEIMKEYESVTDNIKKIDISEKLSILIDKVNSTNMVGIDSLSYVLQLRNVLFDEYEKVQNITVTIIRNNEPYDKDKIAMASAIFTLNPNNYYNDEDSNIYYYFNPNKRLIPITKEELQAKFNDGIFEYIDVNNPPIPGIDAKEGVSK